jgi:hypothetical protein
MCKSAYRPAQALLSPRNVERVGLPEYADPERHPRSPAMIPTSDHTACHISDVTHKRLC